MILKSIFLKTLAMLMSFAFFVICGTACSGNPSHSGSSSENPSGGGEQSDSSLSFSQSEEKEEPEEYSLLTDKKFKRGFKVRGLGLPIYPEHADEETFGDAYDTGYVFDYGKTTEDAPLWSVCQWSTRYAFHDTSITTFTAKGRTYTYENKSKLFRVNTGTGEFTLGLKASECYVYGDRYGTQEWPHLLISRENINRNEFSRIYGKEEIRVRLNASLDKFEDKMRTTPSEVVHAAQCMFYLYVSNYNKQSNNFSDMLWLGMSIFDSRYEYTPPYARGDTESKESATGKYIYNVQNEYYLGAGNNFYEDGQISVGNKVSIDFDILPFVQIALDKAKEDGYMLSSSYENLYINGMYVGFELPGTYDIQMSFDGMDIVVR